MLRKPLEQIVLNVLYQLQLNPFSYSGRAMCSKPCIAFSSKEHVLDCVHIGVALDNLAEDWPTVFQDVAMNNLGRETVVYFPHLLWPENHTGASS